jgi:hypothetical protein
VRSSRALPVALVAILAVGALASACADSDRVLGEATDDGGSVVAPPGSNEEPDAAPIVEAGPDVEAGTRICSDDGFCHSTLPPDQNLRGVWADGQGTAWSISLEGNILRWNGAEWIIHMTDVVKDEGMFAVWGTSPTDVYVATSVGLLHGTGATPAELVFAPIDLPGDTAIPIKSVWGTGPNDIWAAGGIESFDEWPPRFEGRLLHFAGNTGDAGDGWTEDPLSSEGIAFRTVFGSPTSGVWVHGPDSDEFGELTARVRRLKPGTTTWETVTVPPNPDGDWRPQAQEFSGASLSSDNAVWFSGSTGDFDQGTWQGKSATSGATFDFTFKKRFFWDRAIYGFWGLGSNDTWAIGDSGLIAHWDGTKWSQAVIRVSDAPVGRSFWGIWGKNNDDMWIVGDKIALHKTTQGKP